MMFPRALRSPLAGTILILVVLAALAVPLIRLTGRNQGKPALTAQVGALQNHSADASEMLPTVVRVKLLAAANLCRLLSPSGEVWLELHNVAAGESEHDVVLPWGGGEIELTAEAEFPNLLGETAIFVTLMPDGREDRTAYAAGASPIRETLRFHWDQPH